MDLNGDRSSFPHNVDAWIDQRAERWNKRLDDTTRLFRQQYRTEEPIDTTNDLSCEQQAQMIRHYLFATWKLLPADTSVDMLSALNWNTSLLPALFNILKPSYFHGDEVPVSELCTLRSGRASNLLNAVASIELHLFQFANDAVEHAHLVGPSSPALGKLHSAQALLDNALRALQSDHPELSESSAGSMPIIHSRGGRPVTADDVLSYCGHNIDFVRMTIRKAGPALGLDGLKPTPPNGTDPSCTDEHLAAAFDLIQSIVKRPRGTTLREVPSRLSRDFSHAFELILHCNEEIHKSWTADSTSRDDDGHLRRMRISLIMTLFSTRLILTYDSSSSESLMSQIRRNINHFANGEWYKVVNNYLRIAPRHTDPLSQTQLSGDSSDDWMKQAKRNVKVALDKLYHGQPSKALKILLSDGMIAGTDDELLSLKDLHPDLTDDLDKGFGVSAAADDSFTEGLVPWEEHPEYDHNFRTSIWNFFHDNLDLNSVSLVIKKAKAHSAPGIGGCTFDLLKTLIYEQEKRKKQPCPSLDTILHRLRYLALILLSADFPPEFAPIFRSNLLIGLKKKNSSVPRPVGIGDTIRRFAGKLAADIMNEPLQALIALWQSGSSTAAGADVVASTARCLHECRPSSMISVRTDVKNAFNSGDRRWIIRVAETFFPKFGPLVRALYEGPTDLYFTDAQLGVHHLQATKGVTQGCPLASHLFNLSLHAIDRRVIPKFGRVVKTGYCDDSYFISEDIAQLKCCTDEIAEKCKRYAGLRYCEEKYEALAPAALVPALKNAFGDSLTRIHSDGMEFVGTPVGLPTDEGRAWASNACKDIVTKGNKSLFRAAQVIRLLKVHEQAFLLRCCLAPRVTHVLRSCPPSTTAEATKLANNILLEAWSHTNGVNFRPELLCGPSLIPEQLRLPITKGGDGITDPRVISNAAFLGSWALWLHPWKRTIEKANSTFAPTYTMRSEAGPEDGSVTGYDNDLGAEGRLKNLSDELLQLCGEIWKSVELCSSSPHSETPAPTNTTGTRSHPGLELETAAAHNQHQMLRSMSPNSDSARETESPVPLDSIRDLKAAYSDLSKYDDGRRYPIAPFWVEEAQRFEPNGLPTDNQPTPVLYKGLATIAEKSLPRLQRYFSRRIHSDARDDLIRRMSELDVLPVTGEAGKRAASRLKQLQGPLSGAFLKDHPRPYRTFWNDEWKLLSCFRFGIPLPSLRSDRWGDEALAKQGDLMIRRHDAVRDALATSLRGIRGFCAHTECRMGESNIFSDLTIFSGIDGSSLTNPLQLDIHVHHFADRSGFTIPSFLEDMDNRKKLTDDGDDGADDDAVEYC